ncbi:hypothetical protein ALC62_08707 [Cyphomyrmex costatus]|uniref:Uncharacterized protein n=1 Tax=Cyphomyrmex costatus TaxID=456900 RepID=A0A151IGJ0_9HYME|nr:hypothetical protein ALC62_08707 [Cyphomyrmex costatus]
MRKLERRIEKLEWEREKKERGRRRNNIRKREEEERLVKINESRYNSYYKNIKTEGLPKYLKGKRRMKDRSIIARFRCGNELRGGQYWREDEERRCRICYRSEENVIHMLKECTETKSEKQMVEFLGEEGKGIETMKKIDKARKEAEKRERRNGSEEADMLDTGSRSCSGIDS